MSDKTTSSIIEELADSLDIQIQLMIKLKRATKPRQAF